MSGRLPELPSGDEPPDREAVADLLASLLPERDRSIARRLLLESILPVRLAGLAEHPRPRRLVETVYGAAGAQLLVADAPRRLAALRSLALAAEVERLQSAALGLATARYGRDHGDAVETARVWAVGYRDWLARDAADFADEAARLQGVREDLGARVEAAGSTVAGPLRAELYRVDLTLRSAASGHFGSAAGSLASFLADVGAPFDELQIS